MSVVVRTAVDPGGLLPAVKREIAAVDPSIAVYDVRTMTEIVERSLAEERFSTTLLTGFALTALALAAIGLYGVVALGVTERTREIGVRIALGASRADVLALIVSGGVRVVLAGVAIGLVVALLAARAVEGFLFETAPADPLVLASVAMLLVVAGAIASYLPARRATRVDPAVALRAE
jgi:putative ABC transport system permease protein